MPYGRRFDSHHRGFVCVLPWCVGEGTKDTPPQEYNRAKRASGKTIHTPLDRSFAASDNTPLTSHHQDHPLERNRLPLMQFLWDLDSPTGPRVRQGQSRSFLLGLKRSTDEAQQQQ